MIVQKGKTEHKHEFKRVYTYDAPKTEEQIQARRAAGVDYQYTKGPRWILLWACTSCPYRQAYDLTHKKPGG